MTPSHIGRYQIQEPLGKGGMATVYRAYDAQFKREVAIKVLPREFLHDDVFHARFEREAQAVAALEHPAIVPVYDVGEDVGQPYLVMRYMAGGTLAERIKQGALDLGQAAAILSRIAPALDEAHDRGFIHRDIKPSNILFDRRDHAYLSDFGIVKIAETAGDLTGSGSFVGTPAYLAPEIIEASGLTPLLDIYALGVTLFEMLAGVLPYDAPTPMGVLLAHAQKPIPDLVERRPTLPPAIQAVIERAMAKDPAHRYPSAGQLAADVEALAGLPASDTPPASLTPPSSDSYQPTQELAAPARVSAARPARRWVWLGLVALVVIAGVVGIAWFRNRSVTPAAAPTPSPVALAATEPASPTPTPPTPDPTATPPPADTPTPTFASSEAAPTPDPLLLSAANVTQIAALLTGWEHDDAVHSVAWSPDGSQLASGSWDNTAIIWNADTAGPLFRLSEHGADAESVAWSPDGRLLATGADDARVILWNPTRGEQLLSLTGHKNWVYSLAWSPDSRKLVSAATDGQIIVWDVESGAPLQTLSGHRGELWVVAWSPDGSLLASGGSEPAVIIWSASTGRPLATLEPGAGIVRSLAWSPDGTQLAGGTDNGSLLFWDTRTWEQPRTRIGSALAVWSVAFSPDGRLLASTLGADIAIWDALTGDRLATLKGHTGAVYSVAFSPDGRRLASGSEDRALIIWGIAAH